MLTIRSSFVLKRQADTHSSEAKRLQRQADAVHLSGAPCHYQDALDLYEERCADAVREAQIASMLYRAAHFLEQSEREARAA